MNQTEFQGSDLRDFLNLTEVASPRIDGWLSKYLVKKTDNKLLIYPLDNTKDDKRNITEETDDKDQIKISLTETDNTAKKNEKKRKTIEEKQRYVKLLKKLLHQRLQRRLRKGSQKNIKTSSKNKSNDI